MIGDTVVITRQPTIAEVAHTPAQTDEEPVSPQMKQTVTDSVKNWLLKRSGFSQFERDF